MRTLTEKEVKVVAGGANGTSTSASHSQGTSTSSSNSQGTSTSNKNMHRP